MFDSGNMDRFFAGRETELSPSSLQLEIDARRRAKSHQRDRVGTKQVVGFLRKRRSWLNRWDVRAAMAIARFITRDF